MTRIRRSLLLLVFALVGMPAWAADRNWTVLASGDDLETREQWQVSDTRLRALPVFDPARAEPPLSPHQATALALAHAQQRYPGDAFVVTEINLQRFAHGTTVYPETAARDWVYLVNLEYNGRGWTQIIPVLLDGTLVSSDREG
ncbi:MAG: hypothetical protein RR704_16700 [Stenotrophomonas sp.]